jgi:hypothetical protein
MVTVLAIRLLQSAIDTALADGECNALEKPEDRLSCYLTKVCIPHLDFVITPAIARRRGGFVNLRS